MTADDWIRWMGVLFLFAIDVAVLGAAVALSIFFIRVALGKDKKR